MSLVIRMGHQKGSTMIGKDKPQAQPKPHPMDIRSWPTDRLPQGIGVSVKDGWNFGIGFGLAMAIAIPVIMMFLGCVIFLALAQLGSSLEAFL